MKWALIYKHYSSFSRFHVFTDQEMNGRVLFILVFLLRITKHNLEHSRYYAINTTSIMYNLGNMNTPVRKKFN